MEFTKFVLTDDTTTNPSVISDQVLLNDNDLSSSAGLTYTTTNNGLDGIFYLDCSEYASTPVEKRFGVMMSLLPVEMVAFTVNGIPRCKAGNLHYYWKDLCLKTFVTHIKGEGIYNSGGGRDAAVFQGLPEETTKIILYETMTCVASHHRAVPLNTRERFYFMMNTRSEATLLSSINENPDSLFIWDFLICTQDLNSLLEKVREDRTIFAADTSTVIDLTDKHNEIMIEIGKPTSVVDEFNVLLPGIEFCVTEREQISNHQIIVLKESERCTEYGPSVKPQIILGSHVPDQVVPMSIESSSTVISDHVSINKAGFSDTIDAMLKGIHVLDCSDYTKLGDRRVVYLLKMLPKDLIDPIRRHLSLNAGMPSDNDIALNWHNLSNDHFIKIGPVTEKCPLRVDFYKSNTESWKWLFYETLSCLTSFPRVVVDSTERFYFAMTPGDEAKFMSSMDIVSHNVTLWSFICCTRDLKSLVDQVREDAIIFIVDTSHVIDLTRRHNELKGEGKQVDEYFVLLPGIEYSYRDCQLNSHKSIILTEQINHVAYGPLVIPQIILGSHISNRVVPMSTSADTSVVSMPTVSITKDCMTLNDDFDDDLILSPVKKKRTQYQTREGVSDVAIDDNNLVVVVDALVQNYATMFGVAVPVGDKGATSSIDSAEVTEHQINFRDEFVKIIAKHPSFDKQQTCEDNIQSTLICFDKMDIDYISVLQEKMGSRPLSQGELVVERTFIGIEIKDDPKIKFGVSMNFRWDTVEGKNTKYISDKQANVFCFLYNDARSDWDIFIMECGQVHRPKTKSKRNPSHQKSKGGQTSLIVGRFSKKAKRIPPYGLKLGSIFVTIKEVTQNRWQSVYGDKVLRYPLMDNATSAQELHFRVKCIEIVKI